MLTPEEPRELSFATLAQGIWEKGICPFLDFTWVEEPKRWDRPPSLVHCCCRKTKKPLLLPFMFLLPLFSYFRTPAFLKYLTRLIKIFLFFSPSLPFLACVIISLTFLFLHLQLFLVLLSLSFAIQSPAFSYLTLQRPHAFEPPSSIHSSSIHFTYMIFYL